MESVEEIRIYKPKTWDNIKTGIITGILAPLFTILIFYQSKTGGSTDFKSFFDSIIENDILAAVLSIGAVPNLLIFYILINSERYKSAKGMVFSTFMYVLIVYIVYFKYTNF